MVQPPSHTRTRAAAAPGAPGPPAGLMVMALRAAEQHVLVVVGEADLHTAGQLRTQLIEMLAVQPPSVLVDLAALEFCDLSGLDALHDAARAADDTGIALTFRGMSPQLAWLHRTFPPRRPVPPPSTSSTPDLVQPVPDTTAEAARSTPTTARTTSQPSGQKAETPQTSASLRRAPDDPQIQTTRAAHPSDARHPGVARAGRPERRTAQSQPRADRYLELEQIVDRLAQLALHAHALAERMDSLPPAVVLTDPARPERIRRLRAGADLARCALAAAARLDLETVGGSDAAGSQVGDRRRADRRATTRPKPVRPARGARRSRAGTRGADAPSRHGGGPAPAGPAQPA